jgi:hypothetical protein
LCKSRGCFWCSGGYNAWVGNFGFLMFYGGFLSALNSGRALVFAWFALGWKPHVSIPNFIKNPLNNSMHLKCSSFLFDSIVECRLRLEDCECNKELGFRLAERVDSRWSDGTCQAVFYCGILNQTSNNQLLCLLYLHSHISIGGIYRSRTVSTRKLCHMQPPPF